MDFQKEKRKEPNERDNAHSTENKKIKKSMIGDVSKAIVDIQKEMKRQYDKDYRARQKEKKQMQEKPNGDGNIQPFTPTPTTILSVMTQAYTNPSERLALRIMSNRRTNSHYYANKSGLNEMTSPSTIATTSSVIDFGNKENITPPQTQPLQQINTYATGDSSTNALLKRKLRNKAYYERKKEEKRVASQNQQASNNGSECQPGILLPLFEQEVGVTATGLEGRVRNNVNSSIHDETLQLDPYDYVFDGVPNNPRVLKKQKPCVHCGAKRFQFEFPTFCCMSGKTKLANSIIPSELHHLFTSQCELGKHFRHNIRSYNTSFSFASMGVKLDTQMASMTSGVYTFRVCGGIYHSLDQLVPRDGQPRYLQLYFYDDQSEFSHRMAWPNLDRNVVQIIRRVLATNPYVATFRSLADLGPLDNYRVTLNASVELDQRVYNRPTTSEVAGIWVEGNDNITSYERSIVVYGRSQYSQKIQPHHGCYDPLCYPLLFPSGEHGWHPKIPRHGVSINDITDVDDNNNDDVEETTTRRGRKTVTMREYYCYKLQIRPTDNLLLLGGRLLQQFVVDQYIKIETTRLVFCERNQARIRADLYQGIVDCINAGEVQSNRVGQRVVLPASFIGGPRDMRRRFLDAMALVQSAGKPDIFLTMTCNPKWDEIADELLPGQTAQDRPELVARAFRAKLEDMKDQLLKKHVLGEVESYVYVIEFQKRGLPHAHFLLIMTPQHKMSNPDHYDKIVCAEIPDIAKHPKLHEYVISHMMHGPCGHLRTSSPCMQGDPKRCRFNYPKEFNEKTAQGDDSYPLYRRRDNGMKVVVRGKTLDNRWVAPYNPKLLMMFNCHINIEVCSSIKSVKYVFKYVYKGHDKQVVNIDPDGEEVVINEIKKYQDARYVSPPEAMWRIFNFPLSKIHPFVMALQLHLPNKQMVRFREDDVMTDIIARERDKRSMLTAFFERNRLDVTARQHLYKDFPKKYTWDVKTRTWNTRKAQIMIGRLVSANPAEGERYYLRLLLTHVCGPTCFEDLYTVNGILYPTFRRAALERGLIESDDNLDACLREASLFQFPSALRRLFVTILIYCEPGDVRKLWDTHYESLSEDYKRQCQSDERVRNMVLSDISTSLQSQGKHLDDFDLPKLNAGVTIEFGGFREVQEECSIIVEDEDLRACNSLNPDQKAAFDEIIRHVDDDRPGVFFIDGPGGTGKTYLYKALLSKVRSRSLIALATASSGAAANNMSGGRTAHSRFKIPLILNNNSMCNIKKQSGAAQLLRMAKVIIWDEASMAKRQAVEAVDRTMQDITGVRLPFGGKIMVLGGDFRQVLPVVRRGTRAQSVDSSLRMSPLWNLIKKMRLTINMRALSDPWFSDFLLRVGDGAEEVLDDTFIRIPDDMAIPYSDKNRSIEDLINAVFPSLHMNERSTDYIISRAILSTKNDNVDDINEQMIGRFHGEEKIYYSFDEAEDDKNNYYPNEFLNSLNVSGLPPHCLRLKVGCPMILLRNLDPSNGLCNGTRLICRSFQPNVIDAEIAVGQHYGKRVFIHRIPLCPSEYDMFPFKLKRKQFPIRLSFAMSINKAQGQTIPNVGVYLPDSVFSHGQLYVALSRGISRASTKVLVKPVKQFDREGVYTSNVVYREVLRDE